MKAKWFTESKSESLRCSSSVRSSLKLSMLMESSYAGTIEPRAFAFSRAVTSRSPLITGHQMNKMASSFCTQWPPSMRGPTSITWQSRYQSKSATRLMWASSCRISSHRSPKSYTYASRLIKTAVNPPHGSIPQRQTEVAMRYSTTKIAMEHMHSSKAIGVVMVVDHRMLVKVQRVGNPMLSSFCSWLSRPFSS